MTGCLNGNGLDRVLNSVVRLHLQDSTFLCLSAVPFSKTRLTVMCPHNQVASLFRLRILKPSPRIAGVSNIEDSGRILGETENC